MDYRPAMNANLFGCRRLRDNFFLEHKQAHGHID